MAKSPASWRLVCVDRLFAVAPLLRNTFLPSRRCQGRAIGGSPSSLERLDVMAEMEERPKDGEGRMRSLLERAFLFERLLPLLDNEDLRRCRLVCRGWRDVFKSLPLSLPTSRDRNIREIMCSFRGAVAMSVKIADDELPAEVFAELVEAENLQYLSIKSFHPWIDVPAATAFFPELTRLRRLSLSWWNEDGCPTIYTSLNHFTRLTALQIRSSVRETDAFDFLHELQQLKELRLHLSIYLESDEEISLPPLTHITHLDINIERWSYTGAWKTFEVRQLPDLFLASGSSVVVDSGVPAHVAVSGIRFPDEPGHVPRHDLLDILHQT